MASVVDVAGINSMSAPILANAAAAMAGMAAAPAAPLPAGGRPLVGATMFGVTTPCVTRARERLERDGYEVLVFHATGTGGRALEGLASAGHLAGVLDVTTTELADELVGGTLSAGPDRLEAAGRAGIPQAVSLGASTWSTSAPAARCRSRFEGRNAVRAQRHRHADAHDACRVHRDRRRRSPASCRPRPGPVALFVPLRGVSMIATEGGPFYDAAADEALFASVRAGLADNVELVELDCDVNDDVVRRRDGRLAGRPARERRALTC